MYEYNDGLLPAGRRPRLYLDKGGKVVKFFGENIPGYCAVATAQYQKNGKWSNTTFQIEFAPGVRALEFISPMHGTWGDHLASWGEVIKGLGLPVGVAQAIVRAEYPKTGERLDKVESFALAIEADDAEGKTTTETVVISFGSPTNRAIQEGYWENPKSCSLIDGRNVTVRPGSNGWNNPEVVTPEGCKIISSVHSPGMHGGYWAIEVIVPIPKE